MHRRLPRNLLRLVGRSLAVLGACAYLAATSHIPLPWPTLSAGNSPFPCQLRRCGCKSADVCAERCCCVAPRPAVAVAPRSAIGSACQLTDAPRLTPSSGLAACCQKRAAARNAAEPAAAPSVVSAPSAVALSAVAPAKVSVRLLDLSLARRCQGLEEFWTAASAVVLPPRVDAWRSPISFDVTEPETVLLASRSIPPPVPPPEPARAA